jgi:hypothetical protein
MILILKSLKTGSAAPATNTPAAPAKYTCSNNPTNKFY